MRVKLKALGCRLNEAELENWARGFQSVGHRIVGSSDEADLIVLNTCAVTQEAVRKSRRLIRNLYRVNPSAKVVVSGCYASLNPDETADFLGVDLVVSNADKDQLVKLTQRALFSDLEQPIASEPGVSLFELGRQRAFVKVQDGCRYRCSFCIVTIARGNERSRCLESIVDEINMLHHQGIQEVILTGVHLGGYGDDLGINLSALIEAVLNRTKIPRIRLGSLEPWDLPIGFFQLFQNIRLMPHLHLPLQSGSDSVLRRMNRRCKTEEFSEIVSEARRQISGINVTTDIIVGFPGETEQDWTQSVNYIRRIGFGHIHIFSYSRREGTKAADLPDQVTVTVKKARSRELHAIAREMKQVMLREKIGSNVPVLFESEVKGDGDLPQFFGYTPDYLRVAVGGRDMPSLENQIVKTSLEGVTDGTDYLVGSVVA